MIGVIRRLGVLLLDYAYVLRHQLRAAFDRGHPEALVRGAGPGAPILLLPGIYETWRFLRPAAGRLWRAGHPVHVITALGRNDATLAEAAAIAARHLAEADLRDVVVVAHSKGGLVARMLLSMPDAGPRIRRVVAVSTPFEGSVLARFVPLAAVRALHPRDPELSRLVAATADRDRIVSVWGWYDPHIPGGCRLEGAHNIIVPVGGHFRLLGSPLVLALVEGLAGEDDA